MRMDGLTAEQWANVKAYCRLYTARQLRAMNDLSRRLCAVARHGAIEGSKGRAGNTHLSPDIIDQALKYAKPEPPRQ